MADEKVFSFGKNWQRFIENNLNEERIEVSRRHLLDFLGIDSLQGKYFLDIGCGSGIHSLAMARSGAGKIVGVDVDVFSVKTSEKVRELVGTPINWTILHGSILDDDFTAQIEPADIVYSWGVLHHTGDLWKAVRNAASRIKPGGVFYIALYIKTPDSDHWIAVKKKYNLSSRVGKRAMECAYVYRNFIARRSLRQIAASLKYMMDYQKNRGMEFWTDIRDWLGGWPYEPATPEEVVNFCVGELGLETLKVKTGEANVEYLFRRPD